MGQATTCKLFGLLAGVLLVACTPQPVPYTVLAQGVSAGRRFATFAVEVLVEAPQFAQVFRALHADQLPPPVPPAVDFTRTFVLLVALGERPTTGYGVEVTRVERTQDTVQVYLQVREPPPGLLQATVLTQPYVLVQLPQDRSIRRVEVRTTEGALLAARPLLH